MADIFGTAGADTLTGSADGDVLHGGEGNDTIYVGSGNEQAYGDAGDDLLTNATSGTTRTGAPQIVINVGAQQVVLDGGDGNDTISFQSYAALTTVRGGAGDDIIHVQASTSSSFLIDAGDGNDSVTINEEPLYPPLTLQARAALQRDMDTVPTSGGSTGFGYTVTFGAGADTLTIIPIAYETPESVQVTDFQTGVDRISFDLAGALPGWTGTNPFADGHARLAQSGSDTLLQTKADGDTAWTTLATLQNTVATSFSAHDFGGLAPTAVQLLTGTAARRHQWRRGRRPPVGRRGRGHADRRRRP